MNLVGQQDVAFSVGSKLVFRIGEDEPAFAGELLPAGEECQRMGRHRVPLRLRQQAAADDLRRRERLVMAAVEGLAGRGDDRLRQLLVVAQAVRQADAVHLALPLLVEGQDRGAGRAGEIAADDHLDRQDVEALADDHVGIGVFEHVVRADVGRALEPVPRRLGQHLPLEGNRGDGAVEGRKPVRRDQDAPAVGQIVILPDLAAIIVRQFRDDGFVKRQESGHGRRGLAADGAGGVKIAGSSRCF